MDIVLNLEDDYLANIKTNNIMLYEYRIQSLSCRCRSGAQQPPAALGAVAGAVRRDEARRSAASLLPSPLWSTFALVSR
eukprot:6196260-Pleurochrysis_carterae.AAC.1